jgi:hypothetical protein
MQEDSVMKGVQIRITAGKYNGKKGWVNTAKGRSGYQGKCSIHIIYIDEDGDEVVAANCIRTSSVDFESWSSKPKTYVQALLDQHPKVRSKTKELCDILGSVEPSLSSEDMKEFAVLFNRYLDDAKTKRKPKYGVSFDRK